MPDTTLSNNRFFLLRNCWRMNATKSGLPRKQPARAEDQGQMTTVTFALPILQLPDDCEKSKRAYTSALRYEVDTVYSTISENLITSFPVLKSHSHFQQTAAFIAFRDSLLEFIRNSVDAKATTFTIGIEVDLLENRMLITCSDNGSVKIPSHKIGLYNKESAVISGSSKKKGEGYLGGAHYALAMATHFVESQGNGSLELRQNPCGNGALVKITSDLNIAKLKSIPNSGEDYVVMMLEDIKQEKIAQARKKLEKNIRSVFFNSSRLHNAIAKFTAGFSVISLWELSLQKGQLKDDIKNKIKLFIPDINRRQRNKIAHLSGMFLETTAKIEDRYNDLIQQNASYRTNRMTHGEGLSENSSFCLFQLPANRRTSSVVDPVADQPAPTLT